MSWAAMKPGASKGRIPAKVWVANEVLAVNQ